MWKSQNSGQTWTAVFEKEPVSAIGAVTIDPTNNDIVWVGTGEDNPRNDVSYGDGVYKSTDGGKQWTNMGLAPTKYISRIVVDPRDHDHVIVAAQGDIFNDSPERGIYVTYDGGKTWQHTLYTGPETGASDLAIDPGDPNVLYAGMWKFQRRPWTFTSGGERRRALQVDRRRTHLEALDRQWFAGRRDGTHRACDRAEQWQSRLRADRIQGGHSLAFG